MAGRRLLAHPHCLDHRLPGAVQVDTEAPQGLRGHTLAFGKEPQQEVLGADVFVVHLARFFLRHDDHPPGPVGKSLEQRLS